MDGGELSVLQIILLEIQHLNAAIAIKNYVAVSVHSRGKN
jgi:hypothetical protein